MSNPFFRGNPMPPQNGGNPFGNMFNIMQQFQQFKANYKGDPRQQIQTMLNSGQMTQEQLEQCENMAKTFQGFLH